MIILTIIILLLLINNKNNGRIATSIHIINFQGGNPHYHVGGNLHYFGNLDYQ